MTFCIWSNCLRSLFTSSTFVPEPAAIRFFLEGLIIDGFSRSAIVIEVIIASILSSCFSSISASLILSLTPGSIEIIDFIEPIRLICLNWSRRSFISNLFSLNFFVSFSASFLLITFSAFSISVRTSPMPSILEAIRSGWNCSKSSSFSPIPTYFIGLPVTARTESAAPPLVSESSFDIRTLVIPIASSKAFATFTAS